MSWRERQRVNELSNDLAGAAPGENTAQRNDNERDEPDCDRLFGISKTLYETNPLSQQIAGEPIADAYAAVALENSAVLLLADGVNWGEKARLAARSAISGALALILRAMKRSNAEHLLWTTRDAFAALLLSFHAAHNMILEQHATLTTLCATLVLPVFAGETPDEQVLLNRAEKRQYVVCSANVGDSLAYVYSPGYGVREVSAGSHDVHSMRDMRDALGALGPVVDALPELANFTCSMTLCEPGDVVFLASDGVGDNFDPVVGKFCVMQDQKDELLQMIKAEKRRPSRVRDSHGE